MMSETRVDKSLFIFFLAFQRGCVTCFSEGNDLAARVKRQQEQQTGHTLARRG